MKNFEKYEEEIKKIDYHDFAFNIKDKKILKCQLCDCNECLFNDSCYLSNKIEWLYEEYNPKAQLTIKEIEDLLKDKYPNGIEVVK